MIDRQRFLTGIGVVAGATALPRFASAATTVRIGYIDSFSGPLADIGTRQRLGAQLAIAEANRRGSVRYELVTADDTSKPAEGATQARRLIDEEKVDALIVGTSSAVTLAVSPLAENAGVFLLAVNPQDTSITGSKANRVTYRMAPNVRMLIAALATRVLTFGKKWYFLQSDWAFGHDGYNRMSAILKKAGGTEVGMDLFPLGMNDFSSLMTKVRNSNADVLMVCQGGMDNAQICKTFVQFGLNKKMHIAAMTFEDYYWKAIPLEQLEGASFGILWAPDVSDSAKKLTQKLRKEIPGPVTSRYYMGYLALQQLIDRMNAAGTTKAEALVSAFADHKFEAYKERPSVWRACDHQCATDAYAGALVSPAKLRKTGFVFDVVASVPGNIALGACSEPDAAAAAAIINGQHVPDRVAYQPKSLR
jgi:branched-chain amino acid transport system substrate-binding protein